MATLCGGDCCGPIFLVVLILLIMLILLVLLGSLWAALSGRGTVEEEA